MNAQEYISSGILETYALGAATQAEKLEVENMLVKYPEVRKALDEIQKDIETYATLHAVEPDANLKEKIISATLSQKSAPGKIISLQTPSSSRQRSFAIAASFLLVVSLGINFFQWKYSKSDSDKINSLNRFAEQMTLTRDSLNKLVLASNSERDSLREKMNFISNPMTQSIALNSMIKDHPMKAVVHWNMSSMKVAVDPMTLPATAPDEKYVLWAIVDGKPVNEGGFTKNDSTGMMIMKVVPQASAFAISLEKSDNVAAPAGPIYVSGAAPSTQP
ncbi:MAG TPA: anti-sigma factor [Bacteroidia bacterium]|nr:anti-sigma factor [Bacteroidia bacterium]